jgi:hypothetical protein
VETDAAISAFAFSDRDFRFESWNPEKQELSYRDASGRYRVCLGHMLTADGHLNRDAPMRLSLLRE